MIAKKYRLTEREVKKVLQKGKPFFSYGIVVNFMRNTAGYNRFAVVIGGKSVNTNVTRVCFRRRFYDTIRSSWLYSIPLSKGEGLGVRVEKEEEREGYVRVSNKPSYDYVFVVKKKLQLDRKKGDTVELFDKDLNFLIKKVL